MTPEERKLLRSAVSKLRTLAYRPRPATRGVVLSPEENEAIERLLT
jgi:hypothetical protein